MQLKQQLFYQAEVRSGFRSLFNFLNNFWMHFKKNRAAVAGLVILLIYAFTAIFATWLAPYDPTSISMDRLLTPSSKHWFGTDNLGRDILSRIIYGTKITITIGFYIAFMSVTIGIVVGAIAGYFGGKVDAIIMRLVEMIQMLPMLLVAIVVLLLLGGGINRIIIILGLLSWTRTSRVVRAEFLSLREREYVEAAKAIGFNNRHIIFNEILPNVIPTIMVIISMSVAAAILAEAALSFLGLGDPNIITWGRMIQDAQKWLTIAWWVSLFPGLAIFLAVLSFNLVGDGITDALNPYLKER